MIFFQDTYNSRLKERYEEDLSIHLDLDPNLWLQARLSGGSNRNQVYKLSNSTTENLQTTRSASIIGYSQSILITQTLEFAVMLNQRVQAQTTHLNEKYERLTADYEEFHQLIMKMRSHVGGTYAPPNCPHGPNILLLLQHCLYFRFIVFERTTV